MPLMITLKASEGHEYELTYVTKTHDAIKKIMDEFLINQDIPDQSKTPEQIARFLVLENMLSVLFADVDVKPAAKQELIQLKLMAENGVLTNLTLDFMDSLPKGGNLIGDPFVRFQSLDLRSCMPPLENPFRALVCAMWQSHHNKPVTSTVTREFLQLYNQSTAIKKFHHGIVEIEQFENVPIGCSYDPNTGKIDILPGAPFKDIMIALGRLQILNPRSLLFLGNEEDQRAVDSILLSDEEEVDYSPNPLRNHSY